MSHPPQPLLSTPPAPCALHMLFQLASADRTLVCQVLHDLRTAFPTALFGLSAQLRRLAVAPSERAFDVPEFPTLAGVPNTQADLYVQVPLEGPPLDEARRARLIVRGVFRTVDVSAGWRLDKPESRNSEEFRNGAWLGENSQVENADPAGLLLPSYVRESAPLEKVCFLDGHACGLYARFVLQGVPAPLLDEPELRRLQELRNDCWRPLAHSLARVGAVYAGGASGLAFFAAARDEVPLENFVRAVHGLEDGVEDPVLAGGLVAGSFFAILNAEEAEFPPPEGGAGILAEF